MKIDIQKEMMNIQKKINDLWLILIIIDILNLMCAKIIIKIKTFMLYERQAEIKII